jgi:hypothetical protein
MKLDIKQTECDETYSIQLNSREGPVGSHFGQGNEPPISTVSGTEPSVNISEKTVRYNGSRILRQFIMRNTIPVQRIDH